MTCDRECGDPVKRLAWLLVMLPLFLTGCATGALWGNRDFREPSKPPELALFESADASRVLVQYREMRDASERFDQRAYWLRLGDKPKRNPHRPAFVSLEQSQGLMPLVIFEPGDTNTPVTGRTCAIASTNDIAFTLFAEGRLPATHRLPVYQDPVGRTKRILLTPLAVAADATIVGGYVFLWWWSRGTIYDFP